MSDYVVDLPKAYKAPFIDPAQEVDDKWVTRSSYKFVDVEWFVDACIKYPKDAVSYGLQRNKPQFVNCFFPKDVSFREDDDEEDDVSYSG